jgi:hypothetical protein
MRKMIFLLLFCSLALFALPISAHAQSAVSIHPQYPADCSSNSHTQVITQYEEPSLTGKSSMTALVIGIYDQINAFCGLVAGRALIHNTENLNGTYEYVIYAGNNCQTAPEDDLVNISKNGDYAYETRFYSSPDGEATVGPPVNPVSGYSGYDSGATTSCNNG